MERGREKGGEKRCVCLANWILKGKVLETQTNARWIDSFRLCSWRAPVIGWLDPVFYSHTSSLWSLLSHYLVDVFYLLAQHCHGRQLSLNTETQSLGQRGRFLFTALLSPRMIKGSSLRGPLKRAGITNFASIFFFCHGEAAQALLQTSVGLSFIMVLSSVYPPAFNRVSDPVGLRHVNSRRETMIVFLI